MQIHSELSSRFVSGCTKVRSLVKREMKNRNVLYLARPLGTVYVVKKGYVRLVHVQPDGRSVTRMLLSKGAMFGDIPFRPGFFLAKEQAIASGATCVLEMTRRDLENHANSDSGFLAAMLHTVIAQHQALDRRMQWQLISPLRTRIAMALSDLLCFSGGRCGHGHLIDVRLTHEEFAELVVAARPVVSEALGELKAEGLISYTRSHLCLLDLDRLQSLAQG